MLRITIEYFSEDDGSFESKRTFQIAENTNEFDFEAKFTGREEQFQFRNHNQKIAVK